ncbi:hypothetical protein GOP47_0029239 [Adiantum capillus-veneris]|nr:hypothetical protein GOP47_0029239 [Adiantum capillus-veneris]
MTTRAADEELQDLQHKVVLVTGASSGLGRDFCLALAQRGCRVIASARRTDRLHALLDDITPLQPPLQHVLLPLDVSASEPEIDAAAEKAWQAFGRIDVLINNAGFRGIKITLAMEFFDMCQKFPSPIFMYGIRQEGVFLHISRLSIYHPLPNFFHRKKCRLYIHGNHPQPISYG